MTKADIVNEITKKAQELTSKALPLHWKRLWKQ